LWRLRCSTSPLPDGVFGAPASCATAAAWQRKRARSRRARPPGRCRSPPSPRVHWWACLPRCHPPAPRPGVRKAKGQYRRSEQRGRRGGLGGHRRRRGGEADRPVHRGPTGPTAPRENARTKGGRRRKPRRGPPLADLAQAGRRDVTVPVCLETDDVRGQPIQGAACPLRISLGVGAGVGPVARVGGACGPLIGGAFPHVARSVQIRPVVRFHGRDARGHAWWARPIGGNCRRPARGRPSRAQWQGGRGPRSPPATVHRDGFVQRAPVGPSLGGLGGAFPPPVSQVAAKLAGPPPPR